MGQPQGQLNPNVDNTEVILRVLNAAPNGGVDDAVLRFDNAILSSGQTGLFPVTTIDNGTIIGIARPGIYRVNFALSQAAATTVNVAVSLNATNVAAEPVAGVAGILAAVLQTNVAAQVTGVYLTYDVPVTAASIRTTPGGRALLRLHCTNGAGAAGGAGITAATAQVQIRRMIGLAA